MYDHEGAETSQDRTTSCVQNLHLQRMVPGALVYTATIAMANPFVAGSGVLVYPHIWTLTQLWLFHPRTLSLCNGVHGPAVAMATTPEGSLTVRLGGTRWSVLPPLHGPQPDPNTLQMCLQLLQAEPRSYRCITAVKQLQPAPRRRGDDVAPTDVPPEAPSRYSRTSAGRSPLLLRWPNAATEIMPFPRRRSCGRRLRLQRLSQRLNSSSVGGVQAILISLFFMAASYGHDTHVVRTSHTRNTAHQNQHQYHQ